MSSPPDRLLQAAEQILQQTRLSEEQVTSHLDMALSPAYWQALFPACSVDGADASDLTEATPLDDAGLATLVRGLSRDGYFQAAGLVSDSSIARLSACTEAVRRAGWPSTFAMVYDEFWHVLNLPSLGRLMTAHLGSGYRMIPHVWIFHIPATSGARGWPPHADSSPHRLRRLTLWIPLTTATLENGCMYVVPRTAATEQAIASFVSGAPMAHGEVANLLQASRALPADVGSVLGWDHQLIHWGSRCRNPRDPRVSLSVEFIDGNQAPDADEVPLLMADGVLPTFAERLRVIARALQSYQRFEARLIRFRDLADRMVSSLT